ncbi:hypothetical protein [Sphingomonas sp. VNH70]|uniref:hypothetical protein n=1 Tax=Sphingomonas silueang TaxID=3156617 RepID=UPI0032B3C51F
MLWPLLLIASVQCGGADPVAMLAQADRLRAAGHARRDPQLLVRGVSCAARASGAVFDIEGDPAPIDLAERIAEARILAEDDVALNATLDAVPVDRGRAGGSTAFAGRATTDRPWRRRIPFDGGETAMLYLRTDAPARMVVRDAAGRVRCDARRASGRVLCRWLPAGREVVEVQVMLTRPKDPDRAFALFTN